MLACSTPGITRVTVVAPSQLMKSELAINIACYIAMHGDDVLFYEPDLPLVKEFLGDRIRPVMARLAAVESIGLGGAGWQKKRDSNIAIRLGGGGKILGLSPDMRTGRSSHTARAAVIDELDKMARTDMVTVAKERTSTYGTDALIAELSTPTTDGPGTVWRSWAEGSRGVWRGRCPECAEIVPVDRGMVNFDRDSAGYWLAGTAALVCKSCGVRWNEAQRQAAIRAGCYVHDDPTNSHQSFRVPGPAHLWRTIRFIFDEGAEAYKAAIDDGDWVRYQAWVNGFAAEPWTDDDRGLSTRKLQRTTYSLGARGRARPRRARSAGAHHHHRDRHRRPRHLHRVGRVGARRADHVGAYVGAPVPDHRRLARRQHRGPGAVAGLRQGAHRERVAAPVLSRRCVRPVARLHRYRSPSEIVKAWTAAKMQEALRTSGAVRALPFGARMLPVRSKVARDRGPSGGLARADRLQEKALAAHGVGRE